MPIEVSQTSTHLETVSTLACYECIGSPRTHKLKNVCTIQTLNFSSRCFQHWCNQIAGLPTHLLLFLPWVGGSLCARTTQKSHSSVAYFDLICLGCARSLLDLAPTYVAFLYAQCSIGGGELIHYPLLQLASIVGCGFLSSSRLQSKNVFSLFEWKQPREVSVKRAQINCCRRGMSFCFGVTVCR